MASNNETIISPRGPPPVRLLSSSPPPGLPISISIDSVRNRLTSSSSLDLTTVQSDAINYFKKLIETYQLRLNVVTAEKDHYKTKISATEEYVNLIENQLITLHSKRKMDSIELRKTEQNLKLTIDKSHHLIASIAFKEMELKLKNEQIKVLENERKQTFECLDKYDNILDIKNTKLENLEKKVLCKVCLNATINTMFSKCNHACMCDTCVLKLRNTVNAENKCPICREDFTNESILKLIIA